MQQHLWQAEMIVLGIGVEITCISLNKDTIPQTGFPSLAEKLTHNPPSAKSIFSDTSVLPHFFLYYNILI